MKKLALAAIGAAYFCGTAMAQDARTMIANAQTRARQRSIHHVLGFGARRRVPAVRRECSGADLLRHARSDAADHELRSRHRSRGADVASYGLHDEPRSPAARRRSLRERSSSRSRRSRRPVSQPWGQSLELYITPWGFLKGAADNNATAARRRVEGKDYTVLSWSPSVKAPSGASYQINGYVNSDNSSSASRRGSART